MSRFTFAKSPTSSESVEELESAVADAYRKCAEAKEELLRIGAAYDDALLRGDESELDELDRGRERHQRVVERSPRIIEILQGRQRVVEAARRLELQAKHAKIAAEGRQKLKAALRAALEANDAAAQAFTEARFDLGEAAGEAVPRVSFAALTRSAVDHWDNALAEAFGENRRSVSAGVPVQILASVVSAGNPATNFIRGDVASFPEAEARRLVGAGLARFTNADDASRLPPDPRHKRSPEPDADGRVNVLFVASGRGPDGAAFRLGDVASFAPDDALRIVRAGRADFI